MKGDVNILNTIGSEDFRLPHQPNFENDIFGQTWNDDTPWKATRLINNNFEEYKDKLLRFFKFVMRENNFNSIGLNTFS